VYHKVPGADRLQPLLALRDPVDVGQAFGGQFGRFAGEERGDGGAVGAGGLAGQIGFQPPFLGPVLAISLPESTIE
jgi:hypothetical protein